MPANLPWEQADLTIQHPRSQWVAWGVKPALRLAAVRQSAGLADPADGPPRAGVPRLPELQGLPRLEFGHVYSTTVAYFATRLNGAPALTRTGATTVVALSSQQMMDLQRLLIKQGYEGVGEVDGKFGAGTRAAIKKAQMKLGLPADSYPTAELIERLSGGRSSGANR